MDSVESYRSAIMQVLDLWSKRPQIPAKLIFESVFDRDRDR